MPEHQPYSKRNEHAPFEIGVGAGITVEGAPTKGAVLVGTGVLWKSEPRIPETALPASVSRGTIKGTPATPYGVAQVWAPGEAIDCGPLIQEAIDSGATVIKLEGQVPFYLNSAVFDDSEVGIAEGGQDRELVIEGNNQTHLVLGPGLPTTAAFTPDATVKWGFYSGTKRTALAAGVVTCTQATAVNGPTQNCGPRMIFRQLVIVGGGRNAGLCFGNEAPNEIDHCNTRGLKYGLSWRGYCDGNKVSNIYIHENNGSAEAGTVAGSWLIYQIDNGDRVCVENISAGAVYESGIWRALTCRGGTIRNVVSGKFVFNNCTSIVAEGGHADLTQTEAVPTFVVNNSALTLSGFYWNGGQTAKQYFLEINDGESGTGGSSVKLINCTGVYRPTTKDTARAADIYITAANANTRLSVENTIPQSRPPTGVAFPYVGNLIVEAKEALVQKALMDATYPAFNRALIGMPCWELRREGTGGEWTVTSPLGGVTASVFLGTPELTVTATEEWEGTLGGGKKYAYTVACKSDTGRHTIHAAAAEAAAGVTGALLVKAAFRAIPASIVVWRKKEGNPITEPEAYAVIPAAGVAMNLVDTGANINGVPWKAAEVPAVYTTNTTCNGIALPGGVELLTAEGAPNTREIPAAIGTLYLNTEGGAGFQMWVKAEKPTEGRGWTLMADQHTGEYKEKANVPAPSIQLVRANAEKEEIAIELVNAEASAGIPSGHMVTIKKIDATANHVKIKVVGGGTIDGKKEFILEKQYEAVTVVSIAANYEVIGLVGAELPI